MGWFDSQIKQRRQKDDEMLESAFADIANSVLGQKKITVYLNDSTRFIENVNRIIEYWHFKPVEIYEKTNNTEEMLEYMLRPHGIMRRMVDLKDNWYHDACGPMLGKRKSDGAAVAFLPNKISGYRFYNDKSNKWENISAKNEGLFEREALCFYKPFPQKSMKEKDLALYVLQTFTFADLIIPLIILAISVLIGFLVPKLNYYIFSEVLQDKSINLLFSTAFFMLCMQSSRLILKTLHSVTGSRFDTKMTFSVQSALMMRILSLPSSFFRQFSSGELYRRITNVSTVCKTLLESSVTVVFTALFSLLYITNIAAYSPSLVITALTVIFATFIVSVITALLQEAFDSKRMEYESKESGMLYSMITGIRKIKLVGAEKRAFARWAHIYSKKLKHPPALIKFSSVINTSIVLIGNIVIYYLAVKSQMNVAQFYAFGSAYSMLSGAFTALSSAAVAMSNGKTVFKMAKPIFDAVPETSDKKRVVKKLNGGIEVSNISFKYDSDSPYIIDNLSFKIKSGEYVAVVGKTGCGKSTLLKLLLGFEKPQRGAIYYDGRDMAGMDLKSLRSKIGTVMQNGKLFSGNIFSNITIAMPSLSADDAWEAAEISGIAEDIRKMPMGMNTIVSESSGGFSGGQKQRILIARAVAPKPKILLFDEATSALDNITQKKVSDALGKMKCTRIVIAHRLSTIKNCDRILVLDGGKIAESGSYDELSAKNGLFAELIKNQKLDTQADERE